MNIFVAVLLFDFGLGALWAAIRDGGSIAALRLVYAGLAVWSGVWVIGQ